jgi:hypothetical protein
MEIMQRMESVNDAVIMAQATPGQLGECDISEADKYLGHWPAMHAYSHRIRAC